MKKILLLLSGCFSCLSLPLTAEDYEIFEGELSNSTFRARDIVTVAHRGGMKYAPENTLAAFRNAAKIGMDYAELDVHLSADGELIVIHDPTVDRTTDGRGRVAEMTVEELKQLDAGSKFSPEFKGEKIPTLREVLEEVSENIMVDIEIKHEKPNEPLLAPKIAELIDELEVWDRVFVHCTSFSYSYLEEIKKFRELEPQVPAGISLFRTQKGDIWEGYIRPALECNATVIIPSPPPKNLSEIVRQAHLYGLSVWTGVTDKEEDLRWLIEQGVDGIFTNDPVLLKRLCNHELH